MTEEQDVQATTTVSELPAPPAAGAESNERWTYAMAGAVVGALAVAAVLLIVHLGAMCHQHDEAPGPYDKNFMEHHMNGMDHPGIGGMGGMEHFGMGGNRGYREMQPMPDTREGTGQFGNSGVAPGEMQPAPESQPNGSITSPQSAQLEAFRKALAEALAKKAAGGDQGPQDAKNASELQDLMKALEQYAKNN